jgi:hypothetical protein
MKRASRGHNVGKRPSSSRSNSLNSRLASATSSCLCLMGRESGGTYCAGDLRPRRGHSRRARGTVVVAEVELFRRPFGGGPCVLDGGLALVCWRVWLRHRRSVARRGTDPRRAAVRCAELAQGGSQLRPPSCPLAYALAPILPGRTDSPHRAHRGRYGAALALRTEPRDDLICEEVGSTRCWVKPEVALHLVPQVLADLSRRLATMETRSSGPRRQSYSSGGKSSTSS